MVDTGIGNAETRALWEKILEEKARDSACVLTHYHPDHAGNAAWLLPALRRRAVDDAGRIPDRARGAHRRAPAIRTDAVLAVFRKNGLDEERAARMRGSRNRYAELVPEFPLSYRRIIEGDEVAIGKHALARDHRPRPRARAFVAVLRRALNTVIAGDMLLSTISTNVSVWSIDPEGDPLRLFLDSIARYRELPEDVLVLPSHGKPFRGAHARVQQLRGAPSRAARRS